VQYHVLASAGQPYWDGATLFRKDAAGTYQPVAGQTTNGIVGVALEGPAGLGHSLCHRVHAHAERRLCLRRSNGTASATYLEMMNGANFFAIGQPGRWEVCQVMTSP
jgi:hypothetical protein